MATTTNLSLRVIERDEEWRLADVHVEGRVNDLDFYQIKHPVQGGVIAPAAIVLDDRRRVLAMRAAREATAATLQSVGRKANVVNDRQYRRRRRRIYGHADKAAKRIRVTSQRKNTDMGTMRAF